MAANPCQHQQQRSHKAIKLSSPSSSSVLGIAANEQQQQMQKEDTKLSLQASSIILSATSNPNWPAVPRNFTASKLKRPSEQTAVTQMQDQADDAAAPHKETQFPPLLPIYIGPQGYASHIFARASYTIPEQTNTAAVIDLNVVIDTASNQYLRAGHQQQHNSISALIPPLYHATNQHCPAERR